MRKVMLFIGLIIIMSCIVSASDSIYSQWTEQGEHWNFNGASPYYWYVALNFTTKQGAEVTSVTLENYNTMDINVYIYNSTGTIPESIICTSTSSGSGTTPFTLSFGAGCTLNEDQEYWIVYEKAVHSGDVAGLDTGRQVGNEKMAISNDGSSWTAQSYDRRIYGEINGTLIDFNNTIPTIISGYNSTSGSLPYGDNESPYSTSDITPTFSFNTDLDANCRIGIEDQNYTTMEDSRNCTIGQGSISHTCELIDLDNLTNPLDYLYISCANSNNGNESELSSSGALEIDLMHLMSNINCKSCNNDNESPYTSDDTTPTFNFTTDMNANCRINDESMNYSEMDSSRNCTTTGALNHTCTLITEDELTTSTDYVYISCMNDEGIESNLTTIELQMDITDLEENATKLIEQGIQASSIWPGATIYSNQQVYLRDLNDNQVLATVDIVAVYGNQRWIFNYGDTSLGLFNITPVVYVLDMVNTQLSTIEGEVTTLIDATKN